MKNKKICCAAALALSSGTALAQTDSVELPETTVVGTSVIDQNTVDSFGSLTTVVGQEQIRDLNALDLSSALRRTPGVVVSRFNPVGSFGGAEGGAVYIRGMGASRPGSEIKTYIDGVPFYMGVWGHPLLDLLPINAMQSISVYKGPQPQKFGNTFAAIDLTPKVAEQGDNHHGELQLTGGSFRTATEQASLIGREGDFDYHTPRHVPMTWASAYCHGFWCNGLSQPARRNGLAVQIVDLPGRGQVQQLLLHFVLGLFYQLKNEPAARQITLAGFGQRDASGGAVEQANVQVCLQVRQHPGNAGRGGVQVFGRTRQAASLNHAVERAHGLKYIHRR